jgi:hypothetical protein
MGMQKNQDIQKQIRKLISRAEREEKTNNWNAAIDSLKKADSKVVTILQENVQNLKKKYKNFIIWQ